MPGPSLAVLWCWCLLLKWGLYLKEMCNQHYPLKQSVKAVYVQGRRKMRLYLLEGNFEHVKWNYKKCGVYSEAIINRVEHPVKYFRCGIQNIFHICLFKCAYLAVYFVWDLKVWRFRKCIQWLLKHEQCNVCGEKHIPIYLFMTYDLFGAEGIFYYILAYMVIFGDEIIYIMSL